MAWYSAFLVCLDFSYVLNIKKIFIDKFECYLVKFRQTKKAEFQAINAIKYLQEIVQLEFGAF